MEPDKEKTAFRTSSGQLYKFNQVPFGLCNAPATFSRLMDHVLSGLHWETCLFYLDDIIVFSSTWEEHLARLRQVFELTLSWGPRNAPSPPKRSVIWATGSRKKVSYQTQRSSAAIREILPPQNRHRSPLFPWSRRVLPAICEKLRSYRRPPACSDQERRKMLLTTSPITAFPDFSQPFRLYTDASTAGLGSILAQVREGRERIICCASRSLNQAEKAYPATKLECLAIVWAVAKFRPYLMAMPFEVFTDHYALQWLKTMSTGSALLHRLSAALEEYDFTVKHRPGKAQTSCGWPQPVAG